MDKLLVTAYTADRDYIVLTDTFGINQRTAYRIILEFKRSGRHHSLPPPKRMTREMLKDVISFETKPAATPLLTKYPQRLNINLTIIHHLDGAVMTIKAVQKHACCHCCDFIDREILTKFVKMGKSANLTN